MVSEWPSRLRVPSDMTSVDRAFLCSKVTLRMFDDVPCIDSKVSMWSWRKMLWFILTANDFSSEIRSINLIYDLGVSMLQTWLLSNSGYSYDQEGALGACPQCLVYARLWGSVVLVTYWWRLGRGMFCGRLAMRMWRVDRCWQLWKIRPIVYPSVAQTGTFWCTEDKGGQLYWNNKWLGWHL